MSATPRPSDCCAPPLVIPGPARPGRDRLVGVHRAVGDPTRFEILRLLAAQTGPVCVCDVVDRFEVGQPTISHHLKVLRDAGLVRVSRQGRWAYYAVDPRGVEDLRRSIDLLTPSRLAETG